MFHATNTRLARLARRARSRLSADAEYAARYGWQTEQGRWGTRRYRDPRFGQLAARRAARETAGGRV